MIETAEHLAHEVGVKRACQVLGVVPAGHLECFCLAGILARGRGGIGVAAVGAHQAVDHQLQRAGALVPIHRRDDEDRVGCGPALVDLGHPVVGLAKRAGG